VVGVGADLRPGHLATNCSASRFGGCSAAEVRQFVGFVFTALALITFAFGVDVAGYGFMAFVFGVAALNASIGLCLGCKACHLIRRVKPA
jgi:uncharacterized membrane protein YidH (DUF202 family)